MKTAKQILEEARTLVEKGWCQRDYARTAAGNGVCWDSLLACKFCSSGALIRVGHQSRTHGLVPPFLKAQAAFLQVIESPDIALWNDAPGRTQADVLAAFDKAIARL